MLNTLRHLINSLVVTVFRCAIVRTETGRRDTALWMSHFQLATLADQRFHTVSFSVEILDSDCQRPLSFFFKWEWLPLLGKSVTFTGRKENAPFVLDWVEIIEHETIPWRTDQLSMASKKKNSQANHWTIIRCGGHAWKAHWTLSSCGEVKLRNRSKFFITYSSTGLGPQQRCCL